MRIPWIVTGALAAAGVFWFAHRGLWLAEVGIIPTNLIAAVICGLATGGLIASHAPVRPTREPMFAAVLGVVLVFAGLYIALRSRPAYHAWTWMQLAAIALGAVGGVAGAEAMRRLKGVAVSTMSVMLLSGAVHFGSLDLLFSLATSARIGATMLAFGGVVLAALLTQLVIPVRAPWASASGVVVFPVFNLMNDDSTANVLAAIVGALVLMLFGRIGSAIANALVKRPEQQADLPSARTR